MEYDYKILESKDKKELEAEVTKYRQKGYVCVGGVCLTKLESRYYRYSQAMERPVQNKG